MNGLSRFCYLVEWYDIVQSQANFLQKCESSLHEQTLLHGNLFGGYASPKKHIVFSRLALNDLFLPRCVSEAAVQYDWDIHTVWNCLFVCFSITLVKPEKPLKVSEVEKFYKSVRCSTTIVSTWKDCCLWITIVKGNISMNLLTIGRGYR